VELANKLIKQAGGSEAVVKGVTHLVDSQGGMSGLVSKFKEAGMEDKVKSWLGNGSNEPVSGPEVRQALGDQEVDRIAQDAGLSRDEASDKIAKVLPQTVDELSPEGRLPSQDELKATLGSFGI
jgi:uncharacterized protein YidB (DUF937 family)